MTQAFNLSQLANNINTSGQLNAAAGLYNQVPVANGGTGASTLASGAVVLGAGTSAVTTVPAATSGNLLTANGTAWVSQAASGTYPVYNVFTSPGTWTKPATVKGIIVTVVGGGGTPVTNPVSPTTYTAGGGGGGAAQRHYPAASLPGPQPYTVGSGGAVGASGGTSSFGVAPATVLTGTGGAFGGSGGGATITIVTGVAGGVGSNGNLNIPGSSSATAFVTPSTPANNLIATNGGDSFLGTGGIGSAGGGSPTGISGGNGGGYGGGGGGARGASATGGVGASGVVIIEEFY